MVPRVFFGVKINPKIKKDYLEAIYKEGLSTCQITEALMVAWVEGRKVAPAVGLNQSKTITIIQNFTRLVKRERRLYKTEYKREANCFDPVIGWFFDEDEPLNERGHTIICKCAECR